MDKAGNAVGYEICEPYVFCKSVVAACCVYKTTSAHDNKHNSYALRIFVSWNVWGEKTTFADASSNGHVPEYE